MEHTCPRLYVTVSQAASRKHPRDRDSGLVRPRGEHARAPPSVARHAPHCPHNAVISRMAHTWNPTERGPWRQAFSRSA